MMAVEPEPAVAGEKRGLVDSTKRVVRAFVADEVPVRAAGVAFYAALSIAPMILLFVAITGLLGVGSREAMIDAVTRSVGSEAGRAVATIAADGEDRVGGKAGWSMAVSIAVVLFSASGVIASLRLGLNRVWNVKTSGEAGWKSWIRGRILSMAMVLGIAFLLLVSMVATTVIGMIVPSGGWMWNLITLAVTFGLFTLLFAAMYRVLPDAEIHWRDTWTGAAVTAGLFAVGQYGVGLYLANAGYSDSYGAAGSLVALLVWVYFTALIVFLGAEISQVQAARHGRRIEPDRHAVRVREVVEERGEAAGA